jgi:formylglycine-generating enzyme required for sulfatase activity
MNPRGWKRAAVIMIVMGLAGCTMQSAGRLGNSADPKVRKIGDTRLLDLGDGVTLDLVWIPPGEFMMGSPFGERGRVVMEGRRHQVRLTRGFWMGKYTITQAQWRQVMGANPSHFNADGLPVDQVNWSDCQIFIDTLNRILMPRHLRSTLPTEAQWEYACRAGTQTRFYSGDSDADLARAGWYAQNSGNRSHEVGQKEKNNWGLCDMHGNVWQWCQDWISPYPRDSEPAIDPTGPATGSDRVLRGGAWNSEPDICRSAYRFSYPPHYRLMTIGLRIVVADSDQ